MKHTQTFFRHPLKAAAVLGGERHPQREALRARPLFAALILAASLQNMPALAASESESRSTIAEDHGTTFILQASEDTVGLLKIWQNDRQALEATARQTQAELDAAAAKQEPLGAIGPSTKPYLTADIDARFGLLSPADAERAKAHAATLRDQTKLQTAAAQIRDDGLTGAARIFNADAWPAGAAAQKARAALTIDERHERELGARDGQRPITVRTVGDQPLKVFVDTKKGVFTLLVQNADLRAPLRSTLEHTPRSPSAAVTVTPAAEVTRREQEIIRRDLQLRTPEPPPQARPLEPAPAPRALDPDFHR